MSHHRLIGTKRYGMFDSDPSNFFFFVLREAYEMRRVGVDQACMKGRLRLFKSVVSTRERRHDRLFFRVLMAARTLI